MKALERFLRKLDTVFLPPDELLRNLAGDDEQAAVIGDANADVGPALAALLQELGGSDNIAAVSCVGLTRLRIELHRPADERHRSVTQDQAARYGADALMWRSGSIVHLIAGARAAALADVARAQLKQPGSTLHKAVVV